MDLAILKVAIHPNDETTLGLFKSFAGQFKEPPAPESVSGKKIKLLNGRMRAYGGDRLPDGVTGSDLYVVLSSMTRTDVPIDWLGAGVYFEGILDPDVYPDSIAGSEVKEALAWLQTGKRDHCADVLRVHGNKRRAAEERQNGKNAK